MKWDAVERELVIISRDFERLAKTFAVLALELHKEREAATPRGERGDASPPPNEDKDCPADQPGLPF